MDIGTFPGRCCIASSGILNSPMRDTTAWWKKSSRPAGGRRLLTRNSCGRRLPAAEIRRESKGDRLRRLSADNSKLCAVVAADTPVCLAMCLPVSRCQRNTAISPAMLVAVRLGLLLGRDGRSAMPAVPSARKRAVQRATTFDVTPIYPRSIGFGASALKNGPCHLLSTPRCQTGILVNVHSVLRESLKLRQPQLSRSGSNGQPIGSSHLARIRGDRLGRTLGYARRQSPLP
ncbi:hypothetical protein RHECNPAF_14110020 [Rhizobium etli CNPAF512]|nr:hypothetical protein RHECNPAF_14110020 [Rhizobium etli CNPAF512]